MSNGEEFALDNPTLIGNFDEIEAFPPEFDDSFEEKIQESAPNFEAENLAENQYSAETTPNFETEVNQLPRETLNMDGLFDSDDEGFIEKEHQNHQHQLEQNDDEYMEDNAEEKEEEIVGGEEEDDDEFLGDLEGNKSKKKSRKKKQSRKRKATGEGSGEGEGENENENEEGGEKTKKKRKKSQSKKVKVKEIQYDEDGNIIPEEPEVLTREEQIHREWEEEVKNAKGLKGLSRKRRNEEAVKKEVEQYNNDIETLAERMSDAYRDDKEAIAQNTFAIAKLQLLPQVVIMLHRRNPAIDQQLDREEIDRPIANENFLKACKRWLDPLPDGSLPNLKIRESIIKNLFKLEVDQTVLINSRIGQAIMLLSKHKLETRENKKLLSQLISKWCRPIFDCQVSYADLKTDSPAAPTPTARPTKKPALSQSTSILDETIDKQKLGFRENMLALYPKKAALEFGRRAKETVRDDDEDDKPKKKVNDNSLERQIHEKMAFIKKQSSAKEFRAYNVSANRLPKLYDK
jgi:transcription factor SPN1